MSIGILIATVASVVVALEVGGGGTSPEHIESTGGDTESTGGTQRTIVKHGPWENTVGPLTLVVTEVERQGATVRLDMTCRSSATLTIPFYMNFQASDANGDLFKSQNESETLTVTAGIPLTTKVTLEEVTDVSLLLTISFAHIFSQQPQLVETFSNGIKVTEIPIPH